MNNKIINWGKSLNNKKKAVKTGTIKRMNRGNCGYFKEYGWK